MSKIPMSHLSHKKEMGKKLYDITIKGKNCTWSFPLYLEEKYIREYRQDGLQIEEIVNIFPEWVVQLGLVRIWCFFQDVLNFKNPFNKAK